MTNDIYRQVSSKIEAEWYPYHEEEFFTQDELCRHFDWREGDTRQAVSRKLYHDYREKLPPTLEKRGRAYRIISRDLEEMDWQKSDHKAVVGLKLPFGLEEYVKIFPKGLIVIAGASNAGKTAFLYNLIISNMYKYNIVLYNSETSAEQMKERFLNFDVEIPNPPPFRTVERYDNFADVIDPDGISVIDYVDCDSEFWNNGMELSRIFRVLKKGVAIVALQKKKNTRNFKGDLIRNDLGYGGDTTIKRASLYLSMDGGCLKVVKGKSWVDNAINPNGMMFNFKLVSGSKFVSVERAYEEE